MKYSVLTNCAKPWRLVKVTRGHHKIQHVFQAKWIEFTMKYKKYLSHKL